MYLQHAKDVWADHPGLVAGAVHATGITAASVDARVERYCAIAAERLAAGPESGFPEIQAWRRAFAGMGLKPTQYRCASEALLRRFRKEGRLPRIHPLIDLCNAVSLAYAIPVAALDVARITGFLEVRPATGTETYLTFSGDTENPDPGEIAFIDAAGNAHARRWTNRQSGLSAVREDTASVLIVAEALHDSAATDVPALTDALVTELAAVWDCSPRSAILSENAPRFEFPA
ncbi:B3/B4 domain-containing protein [Thermomonospora cellulosilytica]|uniref:DNA/RNA-binding domain of Phe-tRNA-synthetase-like protein n=1 Tax=Thermomonospora cellulosilytica TaxID=1411118 RepID=A0A7W3N3I6_9ACTN|nr:phenylalanine--tRNA ligase beta subunit-related protein [Thermomonospora cellulosilytica]MBA9006828.1 DNA/RNA-binding domain of Phe-tRNA-synthetase-like protein [Thermomonospora cellulosilytica]